MSNTRVVAVLAVLLALALGGVLWSVRSSGSGSGGRDEITPGAPRQSMAERPVVAPPAPRHRGPRGAGADPTGVSSPAPADPPSPTAPPQLAEPAPLPGDPAASARTDAYGSIAAAAARLTDPATSSSRVWDLMGSVVKGWGNEGQRRVLDAAVTTLKDSTDGRLGPLLLSLAQVEHRVGRTADAAEHLTQAVLAMRPDWLDDTRGMPRLVFFALGPNVEMWSPTDLATNRTKDSRIGSLYSRSGAAWWDGGSWIPHTFDSSGASQPFIDWLQTVAADDAQPEQAMAASIWVHAVTCRHNWQTLVHGLPAAARRRAVEVTPERLVAASTNLEWQNVFDERRSAGLHAGLAWARELDVCARRVAALKREAPSGSFVPASLNETVVWSLSDEFAARFAKIDTPRADALRKLAAHLAEFPAKPVATDTGK